MSRVSGCSRSNSSRALSGQPLSGGFCSGALANPRRRPLNSWREHTYGASRMIRVLVVAVALLAAAPAGAQTASAVEQQIRDAEQKYNAAYAANDLPTYFSYLAPDFGQWLPSGRTDQP